MGADDVIKKSTDARQVAGDVQRLAAALPQGVRKARISIHCRDCGRRWERKVNMTDPQSPQAFQDLVREGRIHASLYEHRNVNMTVEALR